jgi:putative transposase
MKTDDDKNPDFPQRSHPAHPPPISKHNCPVIIFLTVCLSPKNPLLANQQAHSALYDAWREADKWVVGYYMIMPDHIHLFCSPADNQNTGLKKWVSFWKYLVSKNYHPVSGKWQNDCWDTQMRSTDHWLQKAEYIRNNPVRRGLTKNSENWPYQGVMAELFW